MYVNRLWCALAAPWRVALAEGWAAYRAGSVPIGACLVDHGGVVVAHGRNRVAERTGGDAAIAGTRLAHAEVNALLALAGWEGDPRTLTLYTSVEPCPLCVGAIVIANVRRVRFAARDPWAGSAAMFGATTYVRSKAIGVAGPDPALETALAAMQVESWLARDVPRARELVDAERLLLPRAVSIGEALHRTGRLRALASRGAETWEAIELLAGAVRRSSSTLAHESV